MALVLILDEKKKKRSSWSFYAREGSHWPRLRWLLVIAFVGWVMFNGLVAALAAAGAPGKADPVWHTPLYWIFG